MGLDNGPMATADIQAKLADRKTVIWNGPMGVLEFEAFAKGVAIADSLAEMTGKGCITIIGGGDSVAAVEKAGLAEDVAHLDGGGASLELLEGKVPPGVAALRRREALQRGAAQVKHRQCAGVCSENCALRATTCLDIKRAASRAPACRTAPT